MDRYAVGDLVLAKTKNNPSWPARITVPPNNIKKLKNTTNKYCVYFFGTRDYAWIHHKQLQKYTPWNAKKPLPKKRHFSEAVEEANIYYKYQQESSQTIEHHVPQEPKAKRRRTCNKLESNESTTVLRDIKDYALIEKEVGFIGLGQLGSKLVNIFLSNSQDIVLWNRTIEKCDDYCKAGAFLAFSPCDVANRCKVFFICVSDVEAVKQINDATNGIFKADLKGKTYIQLSSVSPEFSIETAKMVEEKGGRYVEVQLIGSIRYLEDRALLIAGAGCRDAFIEYSQLFEYFGSGRMYLGEVGNAAILKMISSIVIGSLAAGYSEAMALLKKMSLDISRMLDIMSKSSWSSFFLHERSRIFHQDFKMATFTPIDKVYSDIKEFVPFCQKRTKLMTFLTSLVHEAVKKAYIEGRGDQDVVWGLSASNLVKKSSI